ncbi:MAG: hypothetical protein J7498_00015 [Sphingobium sp.]|nr:hypothetical protein [Sphingobium sp.]
MRVCGLLWTAALLSCALPFAWSAQAQDQKQAAPAPAQITPDDLVKMRVGMPDDEIVVTGKALPEPEEVKKQARAITRMDDFFAAPLAQLQERVCPGVMGLPADIAGIIVDRIRWNAERVGLKPAKEGQCRPNILIAFVLNGQMEAQALARSKPWVFRDVPDSDVKDMLADAGPVHAWSSTQTRTRDGMPVAKSESMFDPPVVQTTISDSHIFLAARLDIAQSVVVIDIKAIDGMSVVQLADYATMRAFARTRPVDGDSSASTILALFDKSAPAPRELTPFDLGYLSAIYKSQGNLPASAKIGAIPREIKKRLAKASSGDVSAP